MHGACVFLDATAQNSSAILSNDKRKTMSSGKPNNRVCEACNDQLLAEDTVICSQPGCSRAFHHLCVGVTSKKTVDLTSWKCLDCKSKEPRRDNSNTPVQSKGKTSGETDSNVTLRRAQQPSKTTPNVATLPSKPTQDFLQTMRDEILKTIREELPRVVRNVMTDELRSIRATVKDLENSVQMVSEQYDTIKKLTDNQVEELKKLKAENGSLRGDVKLLESKLAHIEEDKAKSEQWARIQNIEVVGVPEDKNESLPGIIMQIAKHTGVSLQPQDLEFVHRVQAKRRVAGRPRVIVARFRERSVKDQLLSAARRCRGFTSKDLGMGGASSKVYVNEHLTVRNKQLLKKCRAKANENNFKYTWTKNCRIYVRKEEKAPFILISKELDLSNII